MGQVLTSSYPQLEKLGAEHFTAHQNTDTIAPTLVKNFHKLVELGQSERLLVVGCGPKPQMMMELAGFGFDVLGVEPVAAYVASANAALQNTAVRAGDAEHLPYEDRSIRLIVMESVLEHVDSPIKAAQEMFRVLTPGGIAYVYTTNRFRMSLRGDNGEYRVPFYNWLPKVIKESYVYWHMHHDPTLAEFSPRPAVHWFCYSELCELGRQAGFSLFYSPIDLADPFDLAISKSRLRRSMLPLVQSSPWLRGLALLQFGSAIFMYKRG